jgi:hypothetical protein
MNIQLYQLIPTFGRPLLYSLGDNAFNMGLIFGSCALLSEMETNEKLSKCFKFNTKIASNLLILSSLINIYRINRF